jgi:hypothetical protein
MIWLSDARKGEVTWFDESLRSVFRLRCEECGEFSDGRAPVKISGKWGFVDRRGRMVIPAKLPMARPFSEGLAAVKPRGGNHTHIPEDWYYMDTSGRFRLGPFRACEAGPFREGLAALVEKRVRRSGRMLPDSFVIDRNGKVVFRRSQCHIGAFRDGVAPFTALRFTDATRRLGYVDSTGFVIWDPDRDGGQ